MKLLTKAIEAKLAKAPLYSQENQNVVPILVKFFNPTGSGTWYATEGSLVCPEHGYYDCTECPKDSTWQWLFFGLADIHEKELGYFSLRDLLGYRGRFGLGIERDLHFDGYVLDKVTNEVRRAHTHDFTLQADDTRVCACGEKRGL